MRAVLAANVTGPSEPVAVGLKSLATETNIFDLI
jgi:hypothetical protein